MKTPINAVAVNVATPNVAAENPLRIFHEDERGIETLQVVMIIAIAAIVLLMVKIFWTQIRGWASNLLTQITGWTSPSN